MTSSDNDNNIIKFINSFIGKWILYVAGIAAVAVVLHLTPWFNYHPFKLFFTPTGFLGTVMHLIGFSYWYMAFSSGIGMGVIGLWLIGNVLYAVSAF
jgi:hypothetical protein